jgi:hypothetical protein
VCLATDAERFTALAEGMPPSQLARFLNRYFEAVFPPITEKEGAIVDLIGDAVLALWTGGDGDRSLHLKACGAALELMSAVDRFNAASPTLRLPTRIGISGGEVATSPMGAVNHFEFRPVGDTVVTSVRLQELNKLLGTRILAAAPVIRGFDALAGVCFSYAARTFPLTSSRSWANARAPAPTSCNSASSSRWHWTLCAAVGAKPPWSASRPYTTVIRRTDLRPSTCIGYPQTRCGVAVRSDSLREHTARYVTSSRVAYNRQRRLD